MATLRARIGGQWVDVTQPPPVVPNEVFVGPDAPVDPDVELWVDEDADPAAAAAGGAEIVVDTVDPYVTDPASTAMMWLDPTPTETWPHLDISPNPAPIGVPATVTGRNLKPNTDHYIYDSTSTSEVTIANPAATTDANGVCVWTLTWILRNSNGVSTLDVRDMSASAPDDYPIQDERFYCA